MWFKNLVFFSYLVHASKAGTTTECVVDPDVVNEIIHNTIEEDLRKQMVEEMKQGSKHDSSGGTGKVKRSAWHKTVLIRWEDPLLSKDADKLLVKQLGDAKIISTANDDDFLRNLETRQYDDIMLAPGVCRYSYLKYDIPGSNARTLGWDVAKYRTTIRSYQGGVKIVETMEERDVIPLLRSALQYP